MKIDSDKKLIQISIRELIYPIFSRHNGSSLPFYLRTNKGTEIHSQYQKSVKNQNKHTRTSVKSEFRVKLNRKVGEWTFTLTGRTDLVQTSGNIITVEEIKSVNQLDAFSIDSEASLNYIIQLLFYAQYFQETYPNKEIQCRLILIDVFTEEKHVHPIEFTSVYPILDEKCQALLKQLNQNNKISKKKQQRVDSILFPFSSTRPHQADIMQKTELLLKNKGRMLLSAPSGLGKTVGTLYPALKFTIGENKRLFVVTSKTTQQKMYEDTLRLFAKNKGKFNAIILTAKEKMCLNSTYNCDPTYCSYAQSVPDDYESIIKSIMKNKVLTARYLKKKAEELKVCPFELALDCSLYCDVIVGDYNYVFSPIIKLQRFFKGKYNDCICIIDEAHNLPDRAREYYSPELTIEMIEECIDYIQNQAISSKLKNPIISQLKDLQDHIKNVIQSLPDSNIRVTTVSLDQPYFTHCLAKFEDLVLTYVGYFMQQYEMEPMMGDLFVIFVKHLHFFHQILEQSDKDEFERLVYPKEDKIKITCKSAAKFLEKQMKGFFSVLSQSATLQPVGYYRTMLGLPDSTEILQYNSPFPRENRLYLNYPYVSTRFKDRDASYKKIAELIQESIQHEIGNYLAFFPSFAYLHKVLNELRALELPNEIIVQTRRMSEKARKRVLSRLRSQMTPILLIGVHGGIFSEGVDYLGGMAIGAFIISPGLPQYCTEQELIKSYFQKYYYRGFEFAYRNPGMTRVIQAAGRIFRSETDKGFIILVGQRFHTNYYRSVLPRDWDIETPEDVALRVKTFWGNGAKG